MTKPTLQSLATELGLSRQTVSNVLNAPEKVHPATLARVRAAIEASGYRPSAAAQALRAGASRLLGLRMRGRWGDGNAAVMWRFTNALVEEAKLKGYGISLITCDDDEDEQSTYEELFASGAVDAAILTATGMNDHRPEAMLSNGLPFAVLGRPWGVPDASHSWVDVDGAAGIHMAVEHLREQGCERIGYLGWESKNCLNCDRRSGWEAATGGDPELTEFCDDTMHAGAFGMRKLMARGIDGVVAGTDKHAGGAVAEMRLQGIFMPVIGFGNTPVAETINLCSVNEPVEQAAALIVASVVQQIAGSVEPPIQELLKPTLVVRH